ncbi:MAG: hypothetical protein R3224_09350 [Balneolaceae bacterium]|nr:hypothetical protein [Balneolaceae bacterium]
MNYTHLIISILVIELVILVSCGTNSGAIKSPSVISLFNATESHNMGENCMDCHVIGGSGKGWFSVAGTVYDSTKTTPLPNTVVRLYTGPAGTGTIVSSVEVDALGNFFTTDSVDFGEGLFTGVIGSTTTQFMDSTISDGSCNRCHGISTDRIWTQ